MAQAEIESTTSRRQFLLSSGRAGLAAVAAALPVPAQAEQIENAKAPSALTYDPQVVALGRQVELASSAYGEAAADRRVSERAIEAWRERNPKPVWPASTEEHYRRELSALKQARAGASGKAYLSAKDQLVAAAQDFAKHRCTQFHDIRLKAAFAHANHDPAGIMARSVVRDILGLSNPIF